MIVKQTAQEIFARASSLTIKSGEYKTSSEWKEFNQLQIQRGIQKFKDAVLPTTISRGFLGFKRFKQQTSAEKDLGELAEALYQIGAVPSIESGREAVPSICGDHCYETRESFFDSITHKSLRIQKVTDANMRERYRVSASSVTYTSD